MARRAAALPRVAIEVEAADVAGVMILAVGDISLWIEQGKDLPRHRRLAFAEFSQVTPEFLNDLGPSIVLAPLLARGFDCVELAARLHECGFGGRYRIMTPALPNPDLVLNEIRGLFPGLDVDLGLLAPLRPL